MKKELYQIIRLLRLQILLNIFNDASLGTPRFPIFLALIMLLVIPFLVEQEHRIPATLFKSTDDSFTVLVPEGWVIDDLSNNRSMLLQESKQGYGILAQLCPTAEGQQQEGQQQEAITNVSDGSSSSSRGSCTQQQQSQGEIIQIIRFPNLGARLGIAVTDVNDIIPDSVLEYEIQKLQEVGYRDINILNSTHTTVKFTDPQTNQTVASAPARFVLMTYSTNSAPGEIRTGYLIFTATNAAPPNMKTITGYSIFYESASGASTARAEETIQSGSSQPLSALGLIFGSFRLIPSEEAAQYIIHAKAQLELSNQADNTGEEPDQPTFATEYLNTTGVMLVVYSMLVIGVIWKLISYMRKNGSSRLNEIS